MIDRSTTLAAIVALAVLAGILTLGVVAILVAEVLTHQKLDVPEPLPTIIGVAYTAMFSGALFFGHTAATAGQATTLAGLAQQIATTTLPAAPAVTTSTPIAPAAPANEPVAPAPAAPPI